MKRVALLIGIIVIAFSINCGSKKGELSQEKQCEISYQTASNHYLEGRLDQALLAVKKAIAGCPKVWKYWFLKAQLEYGLENFLAAEESAGQCILIKKDCSKCLDLLGVLCTEQKRWSEAESYFAKALANPDYRTPVVTIFNLGMMYYKQANYHKALERFQDAGQKDPSWDRPFYYIGETFMHLNRPDEAVFGYKQATVINKMYCDAWYGLVKSYLRSGDYIKAQEAVQQACQHFQETGKCCKGLQILLH